MTCDPQSLLEAARCFSCIPAGMLASVGTNLLCQLTNRPGGTECTDPQVDDWLARIDADATAIRPPDNVIDAVCIFCQDLRAAGIFNKMLVVNPIIPPTDGTAKSLQAMLHPLIYVPGNTALPFVNNGFNVAHLTVDGLQGQGQPAGFWIDIGFNPQTHWGPGSTSSGGQTIYQSGPALFLESPSPTDIGCFDAVEISAHLMCCRHNVVPGFLAYVWIGPGIVVAQNDTPAYYSANRVADDQSYAYQANSIIAHHLFGSDLTDNSGSILPGQNEYLMAQNNGGSDNFYTAKRVSFMAIHDGLTEPQSLSFFNAIQKMRMSFGGGWV